MAYLVYCIAKEPAIVDAQWSDHDRIHTGNRSPDSSSSGRHPGTNPGNFKGVKGRPIFFVAAHGLCAAVSELDVEEGAPPVSELLAYGKVVEDLHRLQAVVPMRYGCFLSGMNKIRNTLKERQRQYETLLAQLEGHVEMGIRILLPEKAWHSRQEEAVKGQDALPIAGTTSHAKGEESIDGRAYLALRKSHYQMQDETLQGRHALVDCYIQAFSGLYARHRTETETKNGAVILSIYFLIPGSAVNRFREAFEDMMERENAEALLSGPWPPYNFVTPDLAPGKVGKSGDMT
jgi:hypothetical protein